MHYLKTTAITLLMVLLMTTAATAQKASAGGTIIITNLKVYEKDNKQVVEWNADSNATNYWEVQSSADGTSFATIALVLGDDPTQPGTYKFVSGGKAVRTAKKYYRVCYINKEGTAQTSKITGSAK